MMKRKGKAPVTLLLGLILFGSCIDDMEAEPETRSVLAVVNSFLEAEAVLHRMDVGRGLQQLHQGQGYRGIDFYAIPSCDNCQLEIISSNEFAQLVDTTVTMQENRYYTSFLFGTEATPQHFLTEDRRLEGTDDSDISAGLRFFNLANTPRRVTLYIADAEPIDTFRDRPTETPKTGKDTEDFTPTTHTGTHVVTIRDEDGEQLARRAGVALDPGDYLTLFLTGDGGQSAPYYIGLVRHRGIN